jgi:hypothetical protein
MRVHQSIWTTAGGWQSADGRATPPDAQWVLVFGARARLMQDGGALIAEVRARHPDAIFIGCSTAGEISTSSVLDDSIVVTAVSFDRTRVRAAAAPVSREGSREAGRALARELSAPDLGHVFVLSEGLQVNGSELVAGLLDELPPGVQVTGGLSGDGASFGETCVLLGDSLRTRVVAGVGFYGSALRVGYGSMGGWDPFGPDRVITRSEGNVLYELDGKSALALYKTYLGDYAKDLPASGLLFPLLVHKSGKDLGFVRTILAVDEASQSLIFAGDVPQGALARLMKANFDRLIDGASGAASVTYEAMGRRPAALAILISCVGRKLVLQQRTEEEVEAVRQVLGPAPVLTGFYSYGEISPLTPGARCDLHNQTMTITTMSEV